MARNQESIETFMTITGVTEAVAVQKLEEHGGDISAAVNAHFNEGDSSSLRESSVAAPQDDLMDIDNPIDALPSRNPFSVPSEASAVLPPFSVLDSHFPRSIFNTGSDFINHRPSVSHPREVREIPIEVKDGDSASNRTAHAPVIEDISETEHAHGPDVQGTVIVDEEDDDIISTNPTARSAEQKDVSGESSRKRHIRPSAPEFDSLPDYSNDIEEEMVQAAIEASKREVQEINDPGPQQRESHLEDADFAHAVSLSLKTAEQEKALREQKGKSGESEVGSSIPAEVEMGKFVQLNGRLETGNSSIQDEDEDEEEELLVRRRSRQPSFGSMESAKEAGLIDAGPPTSLGQNHVDSNPQDNPNAFPSDEWGGISSAEHDEAVMLEAAMFGGIPEGSGYRVAYAPHQFMHTGAPYPQPIPRPPSPSLQAQRLIREQQDDEYQASLAADREKEMKAMEEAEAHRLQEEAARRAALEEERQKEEESRRKLDEKQELERQLAAKEASLPQEPSNNDDNAVTLLVRMPDGTRRGRRFLKSNNLQCLFDFIDVGRVVNPGTYRLVRPYPRRAFSDGESALTLTELGLTSKQEALFLELI